MQVSMMGNFHNQTAHVLACVEDHADDKAFLVNKLEQHVYNVGPRVLFVHSPGFSSV